MKAEQQYIDLFTQYEDLICKNSSPVMNAPRAEAFAALRGGVQDDRESWLLVTVNLGVCHLLGGDVQAFKRLFGELSAEEKAMQKPAFLWKACVEGEALAASGRPWHKRLFGVRLSAEELRVTLPQPYGWTEL